MELIQTQNTTTTTTTAREEMAALVALDADALVADLAALVREPSVTGDERGAIELVARQARAVGLDAEVTEHDLQALRRHPDHPGEEAARSELLSTSATLPGRDPAAPRLCLNAHVDVVYEGTEPWRHGPWSGRIEDGELHGRGSVDMKAGAVAALHALGAIRRAGVTLPGDVVVQAVPSEEDGGQGTFAALERDDRFAACLIPEPTNFTLVCAQAGAATFDGVVRGRAAHAALRLEGVSALDRYVPIHAALHAHEQRENRDVAHSLMRRLELPYPLLVGRLQVGRWSSQVPDELRFEGRLGVRIGESLADARAAFEETVAAATDDQGPPVEIVWTGGQFAPAEIDPGHPWVELIRTAAGDELGRLPDIGGIPYGADMRLFTDRGIPCAMIGPSPVELAHCVDERVPVADVVALARMLVRVAIRFGASEAVAR
jgi:acetylornithine deacetylase